jgi:hydroxyacylglutathione hydrolase
MITVKTFIFNNFGVNTYVLYDETKQAIIIDPACNDTEEYESLFKFISENQLTPVKIVNTHGHIDHIVGVDKVMKYFNIPFLLHSNDKFLLGSAKETGMIFGFQLDEIPVPTKFISEGDKVEFGNSHLNILHVPGHSPGSIIIYSPNDNFIIAGDVLFSGSIGRSDLPGGDHETLLSGIKTKLLTLPGHTVVYCGHGPTTTIKIEHDTNPFLV